MVLRGVPMTLLLVLAILGIIAIDVWAAVTVLRHSNGYFPQIVYVVVLVVSGLGTCWATFQYEYYLNVNTRVIGWPVPVVVFQRDDVDARWLDYVGPTVVLGYPMNLAIFMFAPSGGFLALASRRRGLARRRLAESEVRNRSA
jgi:hypothetical protein